MNRQEHGIHGVLARLQERIAFLPDYSFRQPGEAESGGPGAGGAKQEGETGKGEASRPGTSVSGIVGGVITLALVFLAGLFLKRRSRAA